LYASAPARTSPYSRNAVAPYEKCGARPTPRWHVDAPVGIIGSEEPVVSRAFVKESEGQELDDLPERVVSPHRNFVTPEGLAQIEAHLARLDAEATEARASGDRSSLARVERDRRYWFQRRATAEVVAVTGGSDVVRFGSRVMLGTDEGTQFEFRIVGEDESDPGRGLISYVSPLAAQLLGCRVGERVSFRNGEAELVAVR
jgi:transcription elongation GreA/GreB family factor